MMLAGAIPTALLAVAVDFAVRAGAVLAGAARGQSAAEFITRSGGGGRTMKVPGCRHS